MGEDIDEGILYKIIERLGTKLKVINLKHSWFEYEHGRAWKHEYLIISCYNGWYNVGR